jgi:hypothetical protein
MEKLGLGRIKKDDPGDLRFLMPKRRLEAKKITSRLWVCNRILDQGSTPMCVGYATWNYLDSFPVHNTPKESPAEIYDQARKLDEIPGEDYEGTTTRGAMKFLQQKGYIGAYNWAFDCEAIIDHVLAVGPVIVGTDWYDRMFTPEKGYIRVGGQVAGGHEWLIVGANRERKNPDKTLGACRMVNSWGRDWSEGGRAWISFQDLDYLIKHNGDATTATELLVA